MAVKHRLWLTGARVLAVVAATTAAVKHHGHDIRIESSSDESKDLIIAEKWRENKEAAFLPTRIARQRSFAASTKSTCSIITYMRVRGILSFFDERVNTHPLEELAVVDFEDGGLDGEEGLGEDLSYSSPPVPAVVIYSGLKGNHRHNTNQHTLHWDLSTVDTPEELTQQTNGYLERESNHSFQHYQVGFPSALHHQSVTLFTALAPLISTCPELENSSHALLEDLGRLYLWGHDFNDGRLDSLLETSSELKSTILELTATISKILITVLSPLLLRSTSDPALVDQVMLLTEMLQHAQSYAFEESQQDEAYESDSEESNDECDADDAALVIRSSVDCLMGLLPSMERSLLSMKARGTLEGFGT